MMNPASSNSGSNPNPASTEPTYTIPQATRDQWKKLAASSGLPYATIVGQHVYDLQGELSVLQDELTRVSGPAPASPAPAAGNSSGQTTTPQPAKPQPTTPQQTSQATKKGQLQHRLAQVQAQLRAYQLEQQSASKSG